jgi:predicted TIM-barrel fold metal-dependent hydrolase
MDKSGIDTAIVSIVQPGVWFREDQDKSRTLTREINEIGARMMRDHPGRFGLWAAIPLPNIDASLREIEFAFDTLKADGIGLMTSFGSQYLGDAAFAPVYEELNRRNAVVYVHPQTPDCCRNITSDMPVSSIEFATDSTRAIGSVLFSGTAARYPNIRWIWSHSGGTMPFLLSRFALVDRELKDRSKVPNGALYELRKFYYDTAQGNHKGALQALLALAPISQVLFGTDFPLRPSSDEIEGLSAFGFSRSDLEAVERGNALTLLPRLRG